MYLHSRPALTHLVAAVEGIPTRGYLVSDQTLAGDEGTAAGEGGRAAGVVTTGVGQTGVLLAGAGLDQENEWQESGVEDHHHGKEMLTECWTGTH